MNKTSHGLCLKVALMITFKKHIERDSGSGNTKTIRQ